MTVLQVAQLGLDLSRGMRSTASRTILLATTAAWVVLAVTPLLDEGAGDLHHHAGTMQAPTLEPLSAGWVATWLLMVAAMMWPLAVPTVSAVNRASYRGWHSRLGLTCLGTVTLLWLAFGVLALSIAWAASQVVPVQPVWWQLAWVGAAIAATRSARRARLLWQCKQLPPLAPGGLRGLGSAAWAGVVSWRRCALLCGPVMVAMVVGHSLALMAFASAAAWWETWHPRAWRDPVPLLLLGAGACWLAATAVSLGGGHG